MKKAYLRFLKKIRKFRKSLLSDKDIKRGKMYFLWLEIKTEIIQNEQNEKYIYENIIKYTLKNYKIDKYIYERLDDVIKTIVNNNYVLKNHNYIFNNINISFNDTRLLAKKILFRRGNVVWIDFGFNIGSEFGGMHPAIILKNFDKELFVLPVSSKKPKEYIKIEKDYEDGKILLEECKKRKSKLTAVIQLDNIYRFKKMTRWADITRMKKISLLRLNFSGTIGKVDGKYIDEIYKRIVKEF